MIRRSQHLALLLGLVVTLAPSFGCKSLIKKMSEKVDASATTTAADTSGDDADTQLARKLDGYVVECLNKFSSRVRDSEQRYNEWVDPKTGPTGKEKNVYGLYDVDDPPQKCVDSITKANGVDPHDAGLEKAGSDYAAALSALQPLITDAYKYYDRDKYKDDKMAKGKAIHKPLVDAFKAFNTADNALDQKVDVQQDALDKRRLAKFDKQFGKQSYPYLVRAALVSSKASLKEADKRLDSVDQNRLATAVTAHESAADDLEKFMTRKGDSASTWTDIATYVEAQQNMVKAEKEELRRVKEKRTYSDAEKREIAMGSGWMVEGSGTKTVHAYNDMIDHLNELQKDDKYNALINPQDGTQ